MKIAFLGAGNMGGALIRSISSSIDNVQVNIYDNDFEKLEGFNNFKNCIICTSTLEACKKSDIIILAMKPNGILEELSRIKELTENKLVISIAAGVKLKAYEKILENGRVIRVMPNLPALINEGMTTICPGKNVNDEDMKVAVRIFESAGKVMVLNEKDMDVAASLAGASPAYIFMLIEAMADAGVGLGLSRDNSYTLSAQAVLGAAKMVLLSNEHPGVLKDRICSPGGTTIEGLMVLEQEGFRSAIINAIKACTEKSLFLGEKFD